MNRPSLLHRLSVLLLLITTISPNVSSFTAQRSVPTKIVVLKPKPFELAVGGTLQIEVEVYDAQGNRLRGIEIKWQLAKASDEAFVYLGSVKNDARTNSVELVWRPGAQGSKPPSEVQPFFHNDTHKANYSSFIDIISNPLAKGLASAWKEAYPDEVARFDQDVLKDDKNVANGATFKTKIFFPKRLLFKDKDPNRNDPAQIRKALGQLIVMGFKFQRGTLGNLSRTP